MAGNPYTRRREKAKKDPDFGTRWCDRPGFVGMSKGAMYSDKSVPPVYVFATRDGYYTMKEEVYCWRMAFHGKQRLSCREAYGRDCRRAGQRGPTPKLAARIADLKADHAAGRIDLAKGPWAHYGWEEEFPDARWRHTPKGAYDDL